MPRSYKPTARFQKVDPRFESMVATKFINAIMLDGKKSIAIDIFYSACDMASKKLKEVESKDVFLTALENVKPSVEVRSKRVGGSNYQVPIPVNPKRAQALAIRWLVNNARKRKGMPMANRLAAEFADACNNTGASVQWKDNVHKMAEANKAFSHFAW
ncbi:MAG: 30S ribosomal protein S7 [Planctomycetes bacterium]|jgi:small subunit ribosomal protein S7|nr:30S ribosomal protein S7 [Planctomycetota bacterium]MBT4028255.1 30S ribosomal protein S7 [Planctomycetota bacterium]MBT4560952.1 30S ribosomal protein S7 [Planctomycetota bacterium]MBT5119184.1 30S ribosomal protein S7 [Planctomycetota bacterium]MBT7013164.1 30S ribosomal protein S7 [Planctomycetota bacterium]